MELIDTKYIANIFPTAIEYNDIDVLSDEDLSSMWDWLCQYPQCTFEYADEGIITKCDITGYIATCITVNIYK